MTQIALTLLGPMQVTVQGQLIVTFPYEKVRALLAYLAIEPDQPHHRDRLAALLWAEQGESKARGNLRKALSVLRQSLGNETAQPPFFLTTRNTIQFNVQANYTLDVNVLTQLLDCQRPYSLPVHELKPEHIANLEQAVALYRGPFLDQMQVSDHEIFETWMLFHRERLHETIMNACSELVSYYEYQRYYEKAQQYVQRQLQLEPWNEAAHRASMRILAQCGRRTLALQQYTRCCQILEQEFATDPEPATVATWEAIRSGSFSSLNYAGHLLARC
jgi:DNA-binding SARP family transcriptional activator